jgi:hypothetical protein
VQSLQLWPVKTAKAALLQYTASLANNIDAISLGTPLTFMRLIKVKF